jgi:GTPase SAR1 family protein
MSSSHHHEEQQRHRRRRRRHRHDHALPELIDIGSQQSHTLNEEPENEQETNEIDWNVLPKRVVRIVVPSSCVVPPDPPEESPPCPLEILKLLVLGEQGSGKSSIVRRFVHRTRTDGAVRSSSASKSSTKSKQQQRKAGSWTVDYYKKDIAFWNSAKTSRCVRVQLWDVGGRSPAAASKGNYNPEVVQLLQRSKAVILVISLDQGPRHALAEAWKWKRWLADMHLDNNDQETKPVYWFLHKSDVIPDQNSTNNMLQLGAMFADTSRDLCFAGWHLTTCEHEDGTSVEEAIMKVVRSNVEERSPSSLAPSLATNTIVSE